MPSSTMHVRRRDRVQSSPPRGMDQEWTEWQVVEGRKVIGRHATREEADEFVRLAQAINKLRER